MTILTTLIIGAFLMTHVAEGTQSVAEVTHSVVEIPRVYTVDSFEQLPAAVHQLPDIMYVHWIKMHNRLAREEARHRAYEFNSGRHSVVKTITNNYNDYTGRSQYNGDSQTILRDYNSHRWGGGPVLILNPYYKK